MMHWMVFSTLATGLFWGLYRLLLRRDGWLQLSRFYLIAAMLFSLVYPLVRLPEVAMPVHVSPSVTIEPLSVDMPDEMPAATAAGDVPALVIVYFAGLAL